LGQAGALIQESLQGYPDHIWLAIGHLAEAEAESQNRWPDFADKLRSERKKMETYKGYCPDIVALIHEVTAMVRSEKTARAKRVPMTDEDKDWFDRVERHLESQVVDGKKFSKIDVNKWSDSMMVEAAYGRVDQSWIVIEVDNDRTMVDYTPPGKTQPTKKLRVRGSNIDRPQIAIKLIDKVAK
jgi:hypothetical protein